MKPPIQDKKTYPITPSGTHIGRCVQIIDQGTQEVIYKNVSKLQAKIFILYELPLKLDKFIDREGNEKEMPFAAVKTYTNSLYEQSALYAHLTGWLGQSFVDDIDAFSYSDIMSKPCMITIVHNRGDDGNTYANIASVTALPDGMECPPQINPSIFFDLSHFDQNVYDNLSQKMQDKIAKSPEYYVAIGGSDPVLGPKNTTSGIAETPGGISTDDIPF